MNIVESVQYIINSSFASLMTIVPNIVGGVLILTIGLVLAQILRGILVSVFSFLKLQDLLKKVQLSADSKQVVIWEKLITEIAVWSVIIVFLIPASEVWGLSKVTDVLDRMLFYLPNVLVAVIIAFVGSIFANLISDVVAHSVTSVGAKSSQMLSALAKYAVLFFTGLVVLNQLGVAQDLIRILFTGIVAMLTVAGGLAFGLGGQDHAKQLLDELKKNLS